MPTSTDAVTISCTIAGKATGTPPIATLHWRVASTPSPGGFQTLAMAGDSTGLFSAVLPAMTDKTIVEFYVSASDGTLTRTWPAPSTEGQTTNGTYQVDNEIVAGPSPVYRLILTATENAAFTTYTTSAGGGGGGGGGGIGDRQFDLTLVAARGTDTTIRYLTSMRVRGNSSRNYTIKPLRISMPTDSRWDGVSDFIITPRGAPVQFLAHRPQRAAGLVAADATPIEVRRNGIESTVTAGSTADHGQLVRIEQLDGDYLDRHFPLATSAPLYRKLTVSNWSYTATTPANPDVTGSGWSKENSTARAPDGGTAHATLAVPTLGISITTTLPASHTALLNNLRITEIMYQPTAAASAGDYEFIELQNIGSSPLDLGGVRFTNGLDYTFPAGATGSSHAILSMQSLNGGTYRALVTASGLTVASDPVVLAVDSSTSPAARLLNLSTRGVVPGGDALIPGFVISGSGTKRLLIRAVGPTLGSFGVTGTLTDSQLTIFGRPTGATADAALLANDNWSDGPGAVSVAAVATQGGAFALTRGSKDAALVVTLPPGNYTAQASGANNPTGIALIEVYVLP